MPTTEPTPPVTATVTAVDPVSITSAASTEGTHNTIALIYTGGTIGMVDSDKGLIPGGNMAERLLNQLQTLPEKRRRTLPAFDLLTLPQLIDSSNATPRDWLDLNRLIRHHSKRYQAFIILHGTDTLAYTSSALSFLLPQNLPCIVTGSQYPLEKEASDALSNVEASLLVASSLINQPMAHNAGVIVFGGKILQGNRTSKISTYSPQGFDCINLPALGTCSEGKLNWSASAQMTAELKPTPDTNFPQISTDAINDIPQVVILKLWPGIQAEQIESLLAEPVKGVILESYGSGNAPDLNQPLLDAFKTATDRGVIIVNRSQCPEGSVSMSYAAGSALSDAGIISGYDMTCETAFSKLTLLLCSNLNNKRVKEAFKRNHYAECSV
ncbi:asparaginase [Oceanospirillum sp.]|uniref:asparaginase n=1 Tax=Oceanospirillum sp. TaxID=2021254 RepID=UPI003A95C0E6